MAKPNPVDLAINEAGGQTALAKKIGVDRQLVQYWKTKGRIPQWRIAAVAKATGLTPAQLLGVVA